ncbi:MAG TPA: aminotransferase [Myxococcales bacterium]|nr:aminotransferase [Myxococcales bacterium]
MVNTDGRLVPSEQAVVSVFDRGFLSGDSVYEVVRSYRGVPFELGAHLARLERSARLIGLGLPMPLERIGAEVQHTGDATGNPESYARIIATRGSRELGLEPGLAHDGRLIVIAKELVPPPPEAYERGVRLALVERRRNEALDLQAKTGNYLNNVLAMEQAKARGAYEALMLNTHGRITEAASANVFLVQAGALCTPPLAAGILEGVTRRVVIALARGLGLPVHERDLVLDDLFSADEAFITSTTRELVPVVAVWQGELERPIGSGAPGPLTRRLLGEFRDRAQRLSTRR